MASPTERTSRHPKRSRAHVPQKGPAARVEAQAGGSAGERATMGMEDEIYQMIAGPGPGGGLMEIHQTNPLPEGSPRVALAREIRACSLCQDEMKALGLPYRIVLRCTHEESDPSAG